MARGCCTARASNDTPPRQAAVWRSGQPLRFISTRSLVHPFAAARHFPSRGNKRLCRFPLRPLEGERATKWRGGAVPQEPQMTLPQAGRRLAVRAAFALLLYARPCTPFCRCAAFPLKGKQEIVPLPLTPRSGPKIFHFPIARSFPLFPWKG